MIYNPTTFITSYPAVSFYFVYHRARHVHKTALATVIPGITLIVLFSLVQLWYAQRDPNVKVVDVILERARRQEEIRIAKAEHRGSSAIPALLMPVIILGSIYGGILTATEAAAVSVIYAVPVGVFYYKKIRGKELKQALIQAGETAGTIMIMLFSVQILSRLYISENLPNIILGALTAVSENKIIILIIW